MRSNEEESDWFGHKHNKIHRDPPRKVKSTDILRNKRIKAEKIQNYLKTTMWFLIFVAAVVYVFIDFSFLQKDNI